MQPLSTSDHNRNVAGLKYVYPVISRRAGGLSIGVNFNVNNACNWRCIYCQVPDLTRGTAPVLDHELLANELLFFLQQVLHGDFFEKFEVPVSQRLIKDIAISGNGEPTTVPGFVRAIDTIANIAREMGVFPASRFVLISNGSLMHHAKVQAGLEALNRYGGEVWFKLDRATQKGRRMVNDCVESDQRVLHNLRVASELCKTRIQTCLLNSDRLRWNEQEKQAYLALLRQIKEQCDIEEVMLYSLARQSHQPEAETLTRVSAAEMLQFSERISALGYRVKVTE